MKQKVLVNLTVVCDPPWSVGRLSRTLEDKAKRLEEWCREFEKFLLDHRSQDAVTMNVEREYQEQCIHCKREWEQDADGPLCCTKAQEEWDKTHAGIAE